MSDKELKDFCYSKIEKKYHEKLDELFEKLIIEEKIDVDGLCVFQIDAEWVYYGDSIYEYFIMKKEHVNELKNYLINQEIFW